MLNIILISNNSIEKTSNLYIASKAMNDTISQNSLITSLLVFGTMLNFTATSETWQTQEKRFQDILLAISEMETINSEDGIKIPHQSDTTTSYLQLNSPQRQR